MASNLSAYELLQMGDTNRTPPLLNKYWPYVLGTAFGVGSACLLNFMSLRPVMSGIQKHAIFSGIWSLTFDYANKRRNEYFAERDAVLRHYIELHPDDFEEPPKKRIGELFEPWIPIR